MTTYFDNQLTIPARASRLKQLRDWVRQQLELQQCSNEIIERMVLAIGEAAMNVVQHGFGDNQAGGELSLKIDLDGEELVFRMTDNAPPIDPTTLSGRDLEELRPGGLGTHIINSCMDKVEYSQLPDRQGNLLIMKKRVTAR